MADEQTRISTGRKPPNKTLAWWYLSRAAKDLLLEERLKGRFGGRSGKAPYWMVQEQGEMKAAVEPLFYIRRAVARWSTKANVKISRFISGR